MGSRRGVFYAYTYESSTQDAPALRTRGGGLKIFHDRSTLPTHPVPQTLISTHTLGSFRGLGACKTVVLLRGLVFKGICCDVICMGCGV